MGRQSSTPPPQGAAPDNLRGSPEAVQKRRLARRFNALLSHANTPQGMDGRTERRRTRLLKELAEGTRNAAEGLKPIEVLQHVHQLLELGETVAALRRVATIHPRPLGNPEETRWLLAELQRAYHFRPEAYEFLGLPPEALRPSGAELPTPPRGRGRPPRRSP